MVRSAVASLMLAGCALAATAPAHGQPVQYQFTPPPPIPTLPSTPPALYPPMSGTLPPSPAPGQSRLAPARVTPPPAFSAQPSMRVFHSRGRTIQVPSSPGESYADRASSCAQAGAAAGLRPNRLSAFVGRCAN